MPKRNSTPTFQKTSAAYAQFRMLRIIGGMIYLLLILVFSGTFWFLYKNMYQSIGQIVTLTDVDSVTATQRVNTDGLESILELQATKDAFAPPIVTRDPFSAPIIPQPDIIEPEPTTL